jgi:hypothetical protein
MSRRDRCFSLISIKTMYYQAEIETEAAGLKVVSLL